MRPLHRLHVESSAEAPLRSGSKVAAGQQQCWRPSVSALLLWVHCVGLACSVFILAWVLRFRGGLPFLAHNLSLADRNDLIFNAHPVLMIIGYIVLTSEAILVFRGVHGTKSYKKGVHLTVQGFAFLMAVLGIWAALRFHNAKGIYNFYSLHSWLGITTVFLFGLQWICAYVVYWYPGATGKVRSSVLPWHIFMGLFIYCMALATAETGLLEKLTFLMVNKVIGRFSLEAMFVNSIGLLLVVYGALVILASTLPKPT